MKRVLHVGRSAASGRGVKRALLLGALTCLGLPSTGCHTRSPPPLSDRALRATRSFDGLTIYWVGRRFEGIPLTAADRPKDYDRSLGIRLYYGDCLGRRRLFASGGCTLPLEINTVHYFPHSNDALGPRVMTRIRGVPAVIYDQGRSIEVYTGPLAIDVFADTPARALRAARALHTLNAGPDTAADQLQPPFYTPGVRDPG